MAVEFTLTIAQKIPYCASMQPLRSRKDTISRSWYFLHTDKQLYLLDLNTAQFNYQGVGSRFYSFVDMTSGTNYQSTLYVLGKEKITIMEQLISLRASLQSFMVSGSRLPPFPGFKPSSPVSAYKSKDATRLFHFYTLSFPPYKSPSLWGRIRNINYKIQFDPENR